MSSPPKVLFIGLGASAVCWYRCVLPAEALGHDWCGVTPGFAVVAGKKPNIEEYDTIVMQQPHGRIGEDRISRLQKEGKFVIYETDDYLHGVRHVAGHVSARGLTPRVIKEYDRCMTMCDGVIVSTAFLKQRYASINPNIAVCRNGIDLARYAYEKPKRDFVTVGWAGGSGHAVELQRWLEGGVLDVMLDHPTSRMTIIGHPESATYADEVLGEGRALGIPWGPLETYPAAMADIDVFLAPAGPGTWYRGKSDLRWMEAAALKAPCICAPHLYPDAECIASSPEDAARFLRSFLEQPDRINSYGKRAFEKVLASRSFPAAAAPWHDVLS